ncbi:hypothetical protein [Winogradskyella sp. Asnod2-B02-A]|uniref:hypothetical protein n=1 Tax=Winogradskyella sp. Asnod2-B02-A TaxID=3160583 RepID=UPI00386A6813
MKNFGSLILGILLGALAMYFYCSKDADKTEGPVAVAAPYGIISPAKIDSLTQAYNQRHKIISDSLFKKSKTKDNRSSWYKLEVIEDYIKYAKHQASENKYTMDGLRLYLGAYPDVSAEEPGLTTLLFVPTGYKNTSEGSFFSMQGRSNDLDDSDGLNLGKEGMPPGANYPQ